MLASCQTLNRAGLAVAVLTWTSSSSKRRSSVSSFSFSVANLLFVVASESRTKSTPKSLYNRNLTKTEYLP